MTVCGKGCIIALINFMLLLHATVRPTAAVVLAGYNHSQIATDNDIHTRKLKKNEEDRSTATKLIAGHDLDLEKVRKKAKFFYGNKNSSMLFMGVLDELISLRMSELFRSDSGYYINSSAILMERLASTQRMHKDYCNSWKPHPPIRNIDYNNDAKDGKDGRRGRNVLLIMCLITRYDDLDLQEWLVWQIMITGAHHIIVYLNEPDADNSLRVLQPFIDAGFVTTFNVTGRGRQAEIYPMCVDLVRKKQCYFQPISPASSNRKGNLARILLDTKDCDPGFKMDSIGRETFIAGFDSDEFPVDLKNRKCIADTLIDDFSAVGSGKKGKVNGLMLPWVCFGHSQHFIAPANAMVTELYKRRMPLPFADVHIPDVLDARGNVLSKNCKLGKAFLRLSRVKRFVNGHDADFLNGKSSQNEFFNYSHWENAWGTISSSLQQRPRFLLYHYLTKSVEQLVKKYFRGVADRNRHWFGNRRDIDQVMLWMTAFNGKAAELDDSIQEQSRMVRMILSPEMTNSSNKKS
eukprot:gene29487-38590_t